MLIPVHEGRFEKDIKLAVKRGLSMKKINTIITMLVNETPLPIKNKNHPLKGKYMGFLECHIEPDWLLIYRKTDTHIYFSRTGTHSDLF